MADQVAKLPPPENGNLRFILIDSYSGSSGRSSGRSNPPVKGQFEIHTDRFLCWALRQTKWQIYPPRKWQFEIHTDRFLLWELRQTRWQIKEQIYLPENGNLRFILIDSYSDHSGRSSGRSTPPVKGQFEIHTDRFLLWELRQTRWQIKEQIYNPENGNLRFILIHSYSGEHRQVKWQINPPQKMTIWDSYW